jgi:hypothetical protein
MELPDVTNPDGTVGKPVLPKWDYIENGQIIRQSRTIEFTGQESFAETMDSGVKTFTLRLPVGKYAPNDSSSIQCVNNKYTDGTRYSILSNNNSLAVNLDYIRLRDDKYTTANEFTAHLKKLYASGNPLVVTYKLATPTYEPIIVDNKILSWDKGTQQVLTPTDENGDNCFTFGANTTEKIEYIALLGGAE